MTVRSNWQLWPRRANWTLDPDPVKVATWLVDEDAYFEARQRYVEDYVEHRSLHGNLSEDQLYIHSVLITQLMERDLPEYIETFFQYNERMKGAETRTALLSSIQATLVKALVR